MKKSLQWIFYAITSVALSACCTGTYKCSGDRLDASYRLLSPEGADLLFGSGRVYNPAAIRFYSLDDHDTIYHFSRASLSSQPGGDSLIFLDFDARMYETVFVKLSPEDIDTLQLRYDTIDASPCCPDFVTVSTLHYNNAPPGRGRYGEDYLKK